MTAALAAASTVVTMMGPATPAVAAPAWRGSVVTGTYSTGAGHAWSPLPTVRVGEDAGTPVDATASAAS